MLLEKKKLAKISCEFPVLCVKSANGYKEKDVNVECMGKTDERLRFY